MMTRHKADRMYQSSSRLSNIHYASTNNKYMSEYIEKNILLLQGAEKGLSMLKFPYNIVR